MGNLGGRPGISAVLIDSDRNGAGRAGGSGQHDRPGRWIRSRCWPRSPTRRSVPTSDKDRCPSPPPTARGASSTLRAFPAPNRAPDRQHRRNQGVGGDQSRHSHRLSAARLRLPVRAARRAGRRREAHHPADRDDGGDGEALRPGRLVGARRDATACRPNSFRWPAPSTPWRRNSVERERELIATNDRLTVMASIDMLSGLANRRGFQSRLDFEWMKAQQYDSELSLLMIDVDHFKLYNDTYGHPEGDACLDEARRNTGRDRRRDSWALPAAMAARNSACCCPTRTPPARSRSARGAPGGSEPGHAARHQHASDRHRQRRRRHQQAQRQPAAGRSDRGRRRRALCRQAPRPQRRGRARLCPDHDGGSMAIAS